MSNVETIKRKPEAPGLWLSFAAAQEAFKAIVKDTKGARGNYAPLDAVIDIVRPILNKHGIVLTQPTFVDGDTLFVRTTLVHGVTGETTFCEYPAGAISLQHQQLGAGVTYARRYSLLALIGAHPEDEDDDGEKAGSAGAPPPAPPRAPQNANQARKTDMWPRFVDKVRGFSDLDELERWWASAETQKAVDAMPGTWPEQAAEEYEKAQERLMGAGRP